MKTLNKFLKDSKSLSKEEVFWILNHPKNWYVHLSYEDVFPSEKNDRKFSVYNSQESKVPSSTTKPKLGYFLWPLETDKENDQIRKIIQKENSGKSSAFTQRPYIHFLNLNTDRILDLGSLSKEEYGQNIEILEHYKLNKIWSNFNISSEEVFNHIELSDSDNIKISNKKHRIFGTSISALLDQYFLVTKNKKNFYTNVILSKKDFKMGNTGVSRQQIISRFLSKDDIDSVANYIFSFLKKDGEMTSELEKLIVYTSEKLDVKVQENFKKFLDSLVIVGMKINLNATLENIEKFLEQHEDKLDGHLVNTDKYVQQYLQQKEKIDKRSWSDHYGMKLWALVMAITQTKEQWLDIFKNKFKYDLILDNDGVITPFDYEIVGTGREGDPSREKMITSFGNEYNQAILLNFSIIKKSVSYYQGE